MARFSESRARPLEGACDALPGGLPSLRGKTFDEVSKMLTVAKAKSVCMAARLVFRGFPRKPELIRALMDAAMTCRSSPADKSKKKKKKEAGQPSSSVLVVPPPVPVVVAVPAAVPSSSGASPGDKRPRAEAESDDDVALPLRKKRAAQPSAPEPVVIDLAGDDDDDDEDDDGGGEPRAPVYDMDMAHPHKTCYDCGAPVYREAHSDNPDYVIGMHHCMADCGSHGVAATEYDMHNRDYSDDDDEDAWDEDSCPDCGGELVEDRGEFHCYTCNVHYHEDTLADAWEEKRLENS